MPERPEWLVLLTSPAYADDRAAMGLDVVLACGAFGQKVTVVLMGAAVHQLREPVEPGAHVRNLAKLWRALPLYDIAKVIVMADAPVDLPDTGDLEAVYLPKEQLPALIANAHHVLRF